jgi:hypothetical protein
LHGRKIRSKKKAVDFPSPRTRRRTTTKIQQRKKKNPLEIGSFKPQKKRNSPAIKQANKQKIRLNKQKQKKNKTPQPSMKVMCEEENE